MTKKETMMELVEMIEGLEIEDDKKVAYIDVLNKEIERLSNRRMSKEEQENALLREELAESVLANAELDKPYKSSELAEICNTSTSRMTYVLKELVQQGKATQKYEKTVSYYTIIEK